MNASQLFSFCYRDEQDEEGSRRELAVGWLKNGLQDIYSGDDRDGRGGGMHCSAQFLISGDGPCRHNGVAREKIHQCSKRGWNGSFSRGSTDLNRRIGIETVHKIGQLTGFLALDNVLGHLGKTNVQVEAAEKEFEKQIKFGGSEVCTFHFAAWKSVDAPLSKDGRKRYFWGPEQMPHELANEGNYSAEIGGIRNECEDCLTSSHTH
ncbi:hypothetical protein LSTR_LSTR002258 [Laodelphax striatellus]|uniref:Uncharacterized protein n=1 Tax=Laodelphax striatellus TaxID=195883 RepID=A0A482XEN3_LAOST|nr:hypothetical protein LSTR_LSTR002258 [Laodelphax striatellus]